MLVLIATSIETSIILFIISVGISIATGYLLQAGLPKGEGLKDTTPSTTAMRGSYVPYVMGRQRVGATFAYVGNRTTTREAVGSSASKGGGKSKTQTQEIYHESAWHVICVGPAQQLHAIYEAGQPILSGGLTPSGTPSGSVVDLGHPGNFTIYWGEEDQPVGAEVSAAIGIASRWPFCCYIFWNRKRLGQAARWPILDYEIDVPIQGTHLVNSVGNAVPSTVPGLDRWSFFVPGGSSPRTGLIYILGTVPRSEMPIGAHIVVTADPAEPLNGTYTIYKTSTLQVITPIPGRLRLYASLITVEEPMPDASASGYAPNAYGFTTLVNTVNNDGVNHAHMIAQLLFDKWPHGLSFDKSLFDLDYFEAAGEAIASESVRGSYQAKGGASALTCAAHILQDMGALMPWNVTTGKFLLKIIRQETVHPTVPEQLVLEPLPKIQTVHGFFGGPQPKADKIMFEFADRTLAYRSMTLVVDDDGRASLQELSTARKVDLPTINDFASAAIVSERRSQEDLGQGAVYTLNLNREARQLFPGQTLVVSGIAPRLRIMAVDIDPLSGKLVVEAVTDYYGVSPATYPWITLEEMEGGVPDSAFQEETPLDEDIETSTGDGFQFYELPGHLQGYPRVSLFIPRIRAHAKVPGAIIHLSADGVTYRAVTGVRDLQTGGELTSAFAADDPWNIEQGPTFDVLGPDIATALDLTGDNANWYGGRQIALIENEAFYLRNITALGGDSYRLDGLVRARYDTVRASHAIGAMVRIFVQDSITLIDDLLIKPGNTLFMKVQPAGRVAGIPLDEIRAIEQVVSGKGLRPMPPGALRTANQRSSWVADADVVLRWGYRSTEFPGTGAGMQGAGYPSGCSAVQGRFLLEMKTTGDVLKRTYTISDPFFTYYNEDLVADFTTEPSSFKVVLTHIHGGLASSSVELTLTRE